MQSGAYALLLGWAQALQQGAPQGRLPLLLWRQVLHAASHHEQLVLAPGPGFQPIRAVVLVLVKQIGELVGELQQTVRLIGPQKTSHGGKHRLAEQARQQLHEAPDHGYFVEWRLGRYCSAAQHLTVSAP